MKQEVIHMTDIPESERQESAIGFIVAVRDHKGKLVYVFDDHDLERCRKVARTMAQAYPARTFTVFRPDRQYTAFASQGKDAADAQPSGAEQTIQTT